jgi:hypothetical protein
LLAAIAFRLQASRVILSNCWSGPLPISVQQPSAAFAAAAFFGAAFFLAFDAAFFGAAFFLTFDTVFRFDALFIAIPILIELKVPYRQDGDAKIYNQR